MTTPTASLAPFAATTSSMASITRTPLALTTIYTPPASCSDIVTWNGVNLWQYGTNQTGGDCYPPGFKKILASYYSPGVCPDAWTSAGKVPHSVGFDAMCCPESFFLTSSNPSNPGYACNSIVTSLLESIYVTSTAGNDPVPNEASFTSINPKRGAATVTADVIQVQWQNKDSEVASLMEQKRLGGGTGPSTGVGMTSPIASPTSIPNGDTSGSISMGAKIGIGLAVPISVLSLLATAAILFWRKRKQKPIEADDIEGSRKLSSEGQGYQDGNDTEGFHKLSSHGERYQNGPAGQGEPVDETEPVHELSSEELKYQDNSNWGKPKVEPGAPQEVEAREWNELPADASMR